MSLNIELPEQGIKALEAKAQAHGVSAEEYARQLIVHDLDAGNTGPEPFWKAFTRQMHAVPAEVFDRLPADGASEHDHYLYGAPKRNL